MKKTVIWTAVIAFFTFVIDWCIVGLKLYDGDYDIMAEACVAFVCLAVLLCCAIYKFSHNRCPHCGKMRWVNGKFCAYCGKEI